MSGDMSVVREVIERIALDIMTVDLNDLSGLGTVHTGLERVAEGLRGPQPACAGLAETLASAVEKIILDECGEAEAALDVVARGIAMLQRQQTAFDGGGREVPDDPALLQEIGRLASGTGETVDPAGEDVVWPEAEQDTGSVAPGTAEAGARAGTPVSASPPSGADADIFFDFVSEAGEHLSSAETGLLSLEKNPEDAETINAVFRSFHTIKGAAGFLNLLDVTRVAHAVEDVLDSARKRKLRINAAILDVALEAVDLLKGLLAGEQARMEGREAPPRDVSGFLSKVAQAAGRGSAEGATAGGERTPEAPSNTGVEPPSAPRDSGGGEGKGRDQHFVRVGTEKLDALVNMVGELVIAQTQVSQHREISGARNERLSRDLAQLVRITRDIQGMAMSMRMVPIRATFERMARMARDLSRKCGKSVDFRMAGEETEVDKNVVEEIVDPLTHMMRNAMDHGLEPAGERVSVGKPERGLIRLDAHHKGGNIVIELSDDGRGIDRERVLKKAIERGLARPDEEFTDEGVYGFLFQAGFSTAEKVSDVSGRGVGMDVVRRNIEKLRGKVEIRSEKGKGSTFTIRLPLTLAIIDGMIVRVGGERYVIPLTSIVRSLRPSRGEVFTVLGQGEMVKVQGDLFPIVRLHARFGVAPQADILWEGLLVLVEAEGGRCCLMVDELLGIQQVVIKGLEDDLRRDKSLSGCTILGDGRVGLILDVNDLARRTNGRAA